MAKFSINLKSGKIDSDKETIIGIDLGTTNSLVAYILDGEPVAVKDKDGKNTLVPSVIHFSEQGVIVGTKAKEKLESDPQNTIYSIKRLLGKSFNDLKEQQGYFGYEILDEDEERLVKIKVDDRYFSPIELSAEILKELKQRIETELEKTVSKAVITVPAYFNDTQRQATRDAGKLAGLEVLRIVNEPTAASLAYGIGRTEESQEEIVAVYDLGGGTFDISILEINDGVFEVLATNGDTYLGGDDFDRKIIQFWLDQMGKDEKTLFADKESMQSIRLLAEKAKKTLSINDDFTGEFEGRSLTITKTQFESMCSSLVEKTIEACQNALSDAEISTKEIDKVILVGGSTRMPMIKDNVSKFFGRPVHDKLDPDEVVALGAAIQADILAGNRKNILLLDVTPLSLGIETLGGLMDTIIPRNSKVPAKAGRNYTTSVDGQKNLKVSVFQGERDLVLHNRKLGEFILSGIPPMPAGIPKIEINFILDADGILLVKAKELRSGVEQEVEIRSQYGLSEEEMALMLLESIKNAESDMKTRALLEAKVEAENIILSAKKFVQNNTELLTLEEAEQTRFLTTALITATKGNDKDAINKAMQTLNEYTSPLAHRVMDHAISKAMKGKEIPPAS